jgi:3-oxoadipate enol-lactonase
MPDLDLSEYLTIHYVDDNPTGNPPLLLIHGLGVTGESWGFQLPALIEAGYRAIAPDLRGFGKSSYPGGENQIEVLAMDMALLLERLKAAPAYIVGTSLGGTVALQLAIGYPQLVKKLVLINSFAHLRPRRLVSWMYFITRGAIISTLGMTTQGEFIARRMFPGDDQAWLRQQFLWQLAQSDRSAYRRTIRSILRFNVIDRLGEIQAPTLVLTGDRDETVPVEVQQRLARRIPGARHVLIPNGRHAMMVVETEEVNRELIEFLGEVDGGIR